MKFREIVEGMLSNNTLDINRCYLEYSKYAPAARLHGLVELGKQILSKDLTNFDASVIGFILILLKNLLKEHERSLSQNDLIDLKEFLVPLLRGRLDVYLKNRVFDILLTFFPSQDILDIVGSESTEAESSAYILAELLERDLAEHQNFFDTLCVISLEKIESLFINVSPSGISQNAIHHFARALCTIANNSSDVSHINKSSELMFYLIGIFANNGAVLSRILQVLVDVADNTPAFFYDRLDTFVGILLDGARSDDHSLSEISIEFLVSLVESSPKEMMQHITLILKELIRISLQFDPNHPDIMNEYDSMKFYNMGLVNLDRISMVIGNEKNFRSVIDTISEILTIPNVANGVALYAMSISMISEGFAEEVFEFLGDVLLPVLENFPNTQTHRFFVYASFTQIMESIEDFIVQEEYKHRIVLESLYTQMLSDVRRADVQMPVRVNALGGIISIFRAAPNFSYEMLLKDNFVGGLLESLDAESVSTDYIEGVFQLLGEISNFSVEDQDFIGYLQRIMEAVRSLILAIYNSSFILADKGYKTLGAGIICYSSLAEKVGAGEEFLFRDVLEILRSLKIYLGEYAFQCDRERDESLLFSVITSWMSFSDSYPELVYYACLRILEMSAQRTSREKLIALELVRAFVRMHQGKREILESVFRNEVLRGYLRLYTEDERIRQMAADIVLLTAPVLGKEPFDTFMHLLRFEPSPIVLMGLLQSFVEFLRLDGVPEAFLTPSTFGVFKVLIEESSRRAIERVERYLEFGYDGLYLDDEEFILQNSYEKMMVKLHDCDREIKFFLIEVSSYLSKAREEWAAYMPKEVLSPYLEASAKTGYFLLSDLQLIVCFMDDVIDTARLPQDYLDFAVREVYVKHLGNWRHLNNGVVQALAYGVKAIAINYGIEKLVDLPVVMRVLAEIIQEQPLGSGRDNAISALLNLWIIQDNAEEIERNIQIVDTMSEDLDEKDELIDRLGSWCVNTPKEVSPAFLEYLQSL